MSIVCMCRLKCHARLLDWFAVERYPSRAGGGGLRTNVLWPAWRRGHLNTAAFHRGCSLRRQMKSWLFITITSPRAFCSCFANFHTTRRIMISHDLKHIFVQFKLVVLLSCGMTTAESVVRSAGWPPPVCWVPPNLKFRFELHDST